MWRGQIVGKITRADLKTARINRYVDLSTWMLYQSDAALQQLIIQELKKRKDKGQPWYGDAVTVITPCGEKYVVEIPYPEESTQSQLCLEF